MASDRLSATLFALADPTRRGILARLATGEASVKELAEPYQMSLAAVSKHLKVLESAGLIRAAAKPNGALAGSKPPRCAMFPSGWRRIAASGIAASTASPII